MKISVVTISFNQAQFLEACIDSVAAQEGPWEHIIVDPGSTDGSREIIARHRDQFSHVILEPDKGPADGLNKGFAKASGDILHYLNSDDIVLDCAYREAREAFRTRPEIDVISGHAFIINEEGRRIRRVYSDPISRHRLAHSGGTLIQPATFIQSAAFAKTRGFNLMNRSSWDSELVVDLFLTNAHFGVSNKTWAGFRIHDRSITASGSQSEQISLNTKRYYEVLMNQPRPKRAMLFENTYRIDRALRHPDVIVARLLGNRVSGSRQ